MQTQNTTDVAGEGYKKCLQEYVIMEKNEGNDGYFSCYCHTVEKKVKRQILEDEIKTCNVHVLKYS